MLMWWHLTAVLITSCYQQLHLWEKWKEVIKLGLFWCCSQSIMVLWDPFIIVKNPKTHEMHLMVQLEHYGSRVEIVTEKNSVKSIFKLILITFSAIWRHNLRKKKMLKFGLSEKHTKFEKIFLMVWQINWFT